MRFVAASFAAICLAVRYSLRRVFNSDESRKIWLITTTHSSYAMGIASSGQVQHLYWGAPLWRIEDLPAARSVEGPSSFDPGEMLENEEFPGRGGTRYYEPALKITRADGNRDLVLHYAGQHIEGDELTLDLKDIVDPIGVALHTSTVAIR